MVGSLEPAVAIQARCSKCNNDKDASDFYRNLKKVNGLESACIECIQLARRKKYRRDNLKETFVNSFKVIFEGEPDRRLLALRLKPIIEKFVS